MMRSGHAPGHIRETSLNAVDAYMEWNEDEPDRLAKFERCYRLY